MSCVDSRRNYSSTTVAVSPTSIRSSHGELSRPDERNEATARFGGRCAAVPLSEFTKLCKFQSRFDMQSEKQKRLVVFGVSGFLTTYQHVAGNLPPYKCHKFTM